MAPSKSTRKPMAQEAGTRLRLGIVRDFRAEGWPSMDLCADQLMENFPERIDAIEITPSFRRMFGMLPFLKRKGFNADRFLNRYIYLYRTVQKSSKQFAFTHVVDHSYAHLANAIPDGKAGVYCHDLDAVRSILEPEKDPRPWWFRSITTRILGGLKKARVVFHNSVEIGRELLEHKIVPAEKLVHAPLGVAEEFSPDPKSTELLFPDLPGSFLLHVGSNIARKRIDVLLEVFARVRQGVPQLKLIQVGGPWPADMANLVDQLGIRDAVTQLRGLTRDQLAELYRRASCVLVTSEAEGFGLPVIEALACGGAVVASDIRVLREVGGGAVDYCRVADIAQWSETVIRVTAGAGPIVSKTERIRHAGIYSWKEHGRVIGDAYLRLAQGLPLR